MKKGKRKREGEGENGGEEKTKKGREEGGRQRKWKRRDGSKGVESKIKLSIVPEELSGSAGSLPLACPFEGAAP